MNPVSLSEWNRFVSSASQPPPLLFHTSDWLTMLAKVYDIEWLPLGLWSDRRLIGLLPLQTRSLGPFRLAGSPLMLVVASTPEGHDKPYKYPGMFAKADVVVLNKSDLLEVFEFDVTYFRRGLEMVNPGVPFFVVSCRTGAGLDEWVTWLLDKGTDG